MLWPIALYVLAALLLLAWCVASRTPGRRDAQIAAFALGIIVCWWSWAAVIRAQSIRLDAPPRYTLSFTADGRQLWLRWFEESDATDRWLVSSRRGALAYFPPDTPGPIFSVLLAADDWQPDDVIRLCRRWRVDADGVGDEIRCVDRLVRIDGSLFLPLLRQNAQHTTPRPEVAGGLCVSVDRYRSTMCSLKVRSSSRPALVTI